MSGCASAYPEEAGVMCEMKYIHPPFVPFIGKSLLAVLFE